MSESLRDWERRPKNRTIRSLPEQPEVFGVFQALWLWRFKNYRKQLRLAELARMSLSWDRSFISKRMEGN